MTEMADDCAAGGSHHYVAVEEGADIGDEDFDGPLVCVKCGDSDVDRYDGTVTLDSPLGEKGE